MKNLEKTKRSQAQGLKTSPVMYVVIILSSNKNREGHNWTYEPTIIALQAGDKTDDLNSGAYVPFLPGSTKPTIKGPNLEATCLIGSSLLPGFLTLTTEF